jgi:hypothetical protein
MVKQGLRLSFLSNTIVEKCTDFFGSVHGFEFLTFKIATRMMGVLVHLATQLNDVWQ